MTLYLAVLMLFPQWLLCMAADPLPVYMILESAATASGASASTFQGSGTCKKWKSTRVVWSEESSIIKASHEPQREQRCD